MVNKAAHRLTNPLAIGAAYAARQLVRFAGFPPLSVLNGDDDPIRAIYATIRRRGTPALTADQFKLIGTPWQLRGHARFDTGSYVHIPYEDIRFTPRALLANEHFLHIDPQDETKVRYFMSRDHLKQDRHTTSTLGRYLTQHYNNDYDAAEIRDIASAFTSGTRRLDIRFLSSALDIERAYLNGPHSCMKYPRAHFGTEFHPTAVYGDSDLQLAVLYAGERITARGLVWGERRVFSRLYGDTVALKTGLLARGYHRGDFNGAKIKLIVDKQQRLHMPYIDAFNPDSASAAYGAACINVGEEAVTIIDDGETGTDDGPPLDEENGEYRAGETRGFIPFNITHRCTDCGERDDAELMITIDDGHICRDCRSNYVAAWDSRHNETRWERINDITPETHGYDAAREIFFLRTREEAHYTHLSPRWYTAEHGLGTFCAPEHTIETLDEDGAPHWVLRSSVRTLPTVHIEGLRAEKENLFHRLPSLSLRVRTPGVFTVQEYAVHPRHRQQLLTAGATNPATNFYELTHHND